MGSWTKIYDHDYFVVRDPLSMVLKKSAARNSFRSAQPTPFGFGSFGAKGICA